MASDEHASSTSLERVCADVSVSSTKLSVVVPMSNGLYDAFLAFTTAVNSNCGIPAAAEKLGDRICVSSDACQCIATFETLSVRMSAFESRTSFAINALDAKIVQQDAKSCSKMRKSCSLAHLGVICPALCLRSDCPRVRKADRRISGGAGRCPQSPRNSPRIILDAARPEASCYRPPVAKWAHRRILGACYEGRIPTRSQALLAHCCRLCVREKVRA